MLNLNQKVWLLTLIVAAGMLLWMGERNQAGKKVNSQASPSAVITADWNQVVGNGPTYYGVEYVWVDQDRELFIQRYQQLHPNLLRVQITQQAFESVNDNADPNVSAINFGITIPQDMARGKTITYQDMFTTLASQFPNMHFQINIWLAATWNASEPNGYLGLGGAFPPLDYAEHAEFVRELARWLVETCGIAPSRLSFSFINEPNLRAFFVGSQADLAQMAATTRAALDSISPQIQMAGLDEVHGTSWTEAFHPNPDCCSAWTFHAYESGISSLWSALQSRIQTLSAFGPVWATEFADTTNGSPDGKMDFSTRPAALGFAQVLGKLWPSGVDGIVHFRLADTYLDNPLASGWMGHGLFADWRGTHSGGVAYKPFPVFWVFSNLYNHFGGGQVVQVIGPAGLVVMGARHASASPAEMDLWVTNPASNADTAQITVDNFPGTCAQVDTLDNLAGSTPVSSQVVSGSPLVFTVPLDAQSSYTVRIQAASGPPCPVPDTATIPASDTAMPPANTPTNTSAPLDTPTHTPRPTATSTPTAGAGQHSATPTLSLQISPMPASSLYLPLLQSMHSAGTASCCL